MNVRSTQGWELAFAAAIMAMEESEAARAEAQRLLLEDRDKAGQLARCQSEVDEHAAQAAELARENMEIRQQLNAEYSQRQDAESREKKERSRATRAVLKSIYSDGQLEKLGDALALEREQNERLNQRILSLQNWLAKTTAWTMQIDLRRDVLGTNFFAPEANGSWTGPETTSRFVLETPPYTWLRLQLRVVDEAAAGFSNHVTILLNGSPLTTRAERRMGKRLPVLITGKAEPDQGPVRTTIELAIELSATSKPISNPLDTRSLGVMLQTIRIEAGTLEMQT